MFIYSRSFAERAAQLLQTFSIPAWFTDKDQNIPEVANFRDLIKKVPFTHRASHSDHLFRKNPTGNRALSVVFHDNMPFILEAEGVNTHNAESPNYNINLSRSFYIRTFIEHLALELAKSPLTNLVHTATAFFQEVYDSSLGICLQRDYTNDEKLFVFNTLGIGEERSNIEPFDAYLRTSQLSETAGRLTISSQPASEFLASIIEDDPINNSVLQHIKGLISPGAKLDSIGTYDSSGIQFCIILASKSQTHRFPTSALVRLVQKSLKHKYVQDHEIANQFASMRHELRPLLRDISSRFSHILGSYPTIQQDRKRKMDFDNAVSDIRKNLTKSLELTDAFGQADLFLSIRDPVLTTSEERAQKTTEYSALIPLLHRVRKQIDPKYKSRTKLIIPDNVGIYVKVDPENLVSVLSKLLDNAHKYTPEGWINFQPPQIRVTADGPSLSLTVENLGPRLEDNEIGELFTKQFRGRRARRLGISGSGIGLYHAKRIAGFQHAILKYNQNVEFVSNTHKNLTRHQFHLIFPQGLWRKNNTSSGG